MRPEGSTVAALLDAVTRRRTWLHVVESLAAAAAIAVVAAWISSAFQPGLSGRSIGIVLGALVGWVLLFLRRDQRTSAAAASEIERLRPSCRNVVVTAEELR